jgi:hypothetical protein
MLSLEFKFNINRSKGVAIQLMFGYKFIKIKKKVRTMEELQLLYHRKKKILLVNKLFILEKYVVIKEKH